MTSPQPIFVIGSYRSATSATTWAIGQHPNIFPLEETNFISRMTVDLAIQHRLGSNRSARTFLSSAGISRADYYRFFGESLDKLILQSRGPIISRSHREAAAAGIDTTKQNVQLTLSADSPKARWVDGTPENSHFVLPLRLMFPGAKFIFILRDPREVARSLAHFESIGGDAYSERQSYEIWKQLVRACALAECAFGSSVVHRIRYEDIRDDPARVVRSCLDFVGEPFCEACLNPFRERINASIIPAHATLQDTAGAEKYVTDAVLLYDSIRSGNFARSHSPRRAYRALAELFISHRKSLEPGSMRKLLQKHNAVISKNRYLSTKLRQANARVEARIGSLVRRMRRALVGPKAANK